MPAGTIVILGDVELFVCGKPAGLRRQLQKALALMVAAHGRRVRRQEIAAAVWGDEDRDVRTLMWSLRKALRDGDSGLDVPPDKAREGNYLLVEAGPGTLAASVDAFRFLSLVSEAEGLREDGDDAAAVGQLTAAAGLWAGEPFADLWPDGPPEACRRLRADLEHARGSLVRALAEAALRQGAPYAAARAYRDRPVSVPDGGHGNDAAWLVTFLVALLERPASDEADRLLAERRGPAGDPGRGRERNPGDAVARADDLLILAEAGIDVHRPLTAAPRPPVTGSPLLPVGRDSELAVFRHALGQVRAGHPAALAVRGASGRGKTRLAEEMGAAAAAADVPVILVSAAHPGDLRSWQELTERLWPATCRDIGAARDRAPARLTLGQRRALLDFAAPRGGPQSPPEPDQAQQVRFGEIARALSALARNTAARRGLIVVLDDADQLSARGRELLGLFLAGLRDAPVGVAVLGRDADGDPGDPAGAPWEQVVVAARPDAARLLLGPLPDQAISSWLRQVRGGPPTGEEVRLVAQATGGEPVRIRDQVAATAAAAAVPAVPAGLPVPAAGPAGPQVPSAWLAAAAITADDLVIDTALVTRMLGLDDADADREERDARLLAWIDTSAGIRFTHGSHRDDVIARLDADPALRRSLHRRAFLALTDRARDKDDPDPSLRVRIAGHARGADRDLPAGEAAAAFLAAARAERASSEAAEAWARAGIAKDPDDPGTRASLHLALGDALDGRGADTAADAEYQLALDIAAGRPADQAEALIRLARRWTDPGKIDWYLLSRLRDGIDALTDEDFPERESLAAVALRLQLTAHLARKSTLAVPVLGTDADGIRRNGVRLAHAALAQVDRLPPAAACEVLNECRWALFDYDPPARTVKLSERLERESLLARSPHFQNAALMTLAIDQLRLGQVADAQGTLLAHERTMPATHAAQWLQLTMETVLDLWHGRLPAAEERLFTVAGPIVARAHAERARVADTLQQTWQGQVYWLRREQGRLVRATDPEVFRQIEGHAFFAIWRAGLTLASLDEGDLPAAAAHVRALGEDYDGFDAFPPHGWTVSVAALLAEACLAMSPAGRPGAAGPGPSGPGGAADGPLGEQLPVVVRRLRAILARYAGEFVLAGWPSVLLGPAERFSGLLALAAGEPEEALHLFEAVTDKVAAAPPQAARLQVSKARALLGARPGEGRAGQAAAARLLTDAGITADRLGMRALAGEARELLAQC